MHFVFYDMPLNASVAGEGARIHWFRKRSTYTGMRLRPAFSAGRCLRTDSRPGVSALPMLTLRSPAGEHFSAFLLVVTN